MIIKFDNVNLDFANIFTKKTIKNFVLVLTFYKTHIKICQ